MTPNLVSAVRFRLGVPLILFVIVMLAICMFFYFCNCINSSPFSCPDPSSLYNLSQNPFYHGMFIQFDNKITKYPYKFRGTDLDNHHTNEWQCIYYSKQNSKKNSPVIASMIGVLKPIGDSWASYHGRYACDDSIDNCLVKK